MSRIPSIDAPERWLDGLPERELYDAYADTISTRFPAFGVRTYDDARFDMAQPLHTYDPSGHIDQAIVDVIVTPASHDRFTNELDAFIVKHGLRGWLDAGESLLFVTDHGQFTDVPVVAETLGRLGVGDRASTVQVVSEMISVLELDLGSGSRPVIDTLRYISAVVQTVPRLERTPSEELRRHRQRMNESGLHVLDAARDTEGSKTVASLIARHNVTSKNGNTLYIHEPNRRTLEGYVDTGIKIVPVCIHCPTFGDDGAVEPADMDFELFAPMQIDDARTATREIVEMFRAATNRMIGDRYKHGVKVRSWRTQMAAQRVRAALPHHRHDTDVQDVHDGDDEPAG